MAELYEMIRADLYYSTIAIVVISFVAAAFVEVITTRVVMRLARRTRTDLDDQIVAAMRRPLFFSVALVGIGLAWRRMVGHPTAEFVGQAALITVAVLLWTRAFLTMGRAVLRALSARMEDYQLVQPRTQPLFEIALKIVVVAGAIYGILLAWHVDVTAWFASAGIIGIAVGFAAKDTLANLFSGIFIIADAPYKIGDFIILDSGERGRVTEIGIRSTRMLTRDDVEIILPNAAIANAKIVNESGGPYEKERVRVNIGVAYGSDIDLVREVLMEVAAASEYLTKDPEPRVRFRNFGDSSLDFQLMGWIDEPVLRGRALDELNAGVYKAFAEHDIEIPFPQRDVHLYQPAA
ncbi:MAG: mechanosensitive ion channel family protein [Deltaproteobacteria bacterium]|nr:mechanosensitive ion channel family protein [Deltaproteobacteria bacterium]MBW2531595.1 mechanosensitive ion channel family protein [Deltaproteobacteria bacterium]